MKRTPDLLSITVVTVATRAVPPKTLEANRFSGGR
jgi:hypothetical protein